MVLQRALSDMLAQALDAAAVEMRQAAKTVPVARLGERKHLVPSFRAAMKDAVESVPGAVLAHTEVPFLVSEWPIKNSVDVGIRLPNSAPLWIELKWGDHKLGEAVWDVSKLALGITKSAASAGVLIAGASSARWAGGAAGAEFFTEGCWSLDHLRSPGYIAGYWQPYVNEGLPQPRQLLKTILTHPVASVAMTLAGESWELRCAEVVPGEGGLEPVVPLEPRVRV
jgi:hypothetical protein